MRPAASPKTEVFRKNKNKKDKLTENLIFSKIRDAKCREESASGSTTTSSVSCEKLGNRKKVPSAKKQIANMTE